MLPHSLKLLFIFQLFQNIVFLVTWDKENTKITLGKCGCKSFNDSYLKRNLKPLAVEKSAFLWNRLNISFHSDKFDCTQKYAGKKTPLVKWVSFSLADSLSRYTGEKSCLEHTYLLLHNCQWYGTPPFLTLHLKSDMWLFLCTKVKLKSMYLWNYKLERNLSLARRCCILWNNLQADMIWWN